MAFDFITSSSINFFLAFSQEDWGNSTCLERAKLILVKYSIALVYLLFAHFLKWALLKPLMMSY